MSKPRESRERPYTMKYQDTLRKFRPLLVVAAAALVTVGCKTEGGASSGGDYQQRSKFP